MFYDYKKLFLCCKKMPIICNMSNKMCLSICKVKKLPLILRTPKKGRFYAVCRKRNTDIEKLIL